MKKRDGTKAYLVYAAARTVVFILRCFPVDWNMCTARLFARVWWHLIRRHRERACAHITLAFKNQLTPEQVESMAKKSLQQLCMFAVDFIFAPHLVNEWTWGKYVRLKNMGPALEVMLRGDGAILLTSHFGNWELAGYLLALFGFDVAAIMRPLDNAYLNDWVVGNRKKKGLRLIDKKGATTSAEQILRQGGALGFIADQNAGSKGLFVDFFGVKASTYKSIGLLAMSCNVPIIVGYAHRTDNRFRFEIGVEEVIKPHQWKNQENPLRWITQRYTSAIEASIRRAPHQYLWIHRRWKSRPRGEKAPPLTC